MSRLDVDPAAWALVNRLLDEALDLPEEAREAWLAGLPPEYEPLVRRLRAMLAHSGGIDARPLGTLPKLGPEGTGGATDGMADSGSSGDRVGPYRLLRLIAEGGMGAVWLAERADGVVQRTVALKLPRGAWQGPALAERMHREGEILATLTHPNIARLYDAGVTGDGHPWLALEYVEGQAIDAHLREAGLDTRGRVRIFLQVLDAVAHAHVHLVVHRDLKPSNVLVTADGQVRLLDFGIAKLLAEGRASETELTRVGGRAFTLAYASPEQVSGQPVGVGSDVYSLGVLLHELLTGSRPYRVARPSAAALEEAILIAEPARPSEAATDPAARRALRGDLDTVVLKALRKRPEERYATVNAFAEDLERWLGGFPVRARPDSASYRLSRFVGRNRLLVGAVAAVVVAVLGGAGVAVWQARAALREERHAEEVKEFIAAVFRDADPYAGQGGVLTAADLLAQARERIDRAFSPGSPTRVELLGLVGQSLNGFEDFKAAEAVLAQAVDEGTRALGPRHRLTLHARVARLEPLRMTGRATELAAELDALGAEMTAVREGSPRDEVLVVENRAHLALDQGRYADAVEAAKQGAALARAALGDGDPLAAALHTLLSISLGFDHRRAEALTASEEALRRTLAARNGNVKHPGVADARMGHGRALAEAGRLEEGLVEMTRAVDDASAALGPTSPMVGFFSGQLAGYRERAGDLVRALADARRHRDILTRTAQPGSYTHASTLAQYGSVLLAARRPEAALPELTTAAAGLERSLGAGHARVYANALRRALALGQVGDLVAALRQVEDARRASPVPPPGREHEAAMVIGVLHRLGGRLPEARASLEEAVASVTAGEGRDRNRMGVLVELGATLAESGAHAQAIAALVESLALLDRLQTHFSPQRADALVALGRAYLAADRRADALAPLREADAFWRSFDPHNRWAREAASWLARAEAASAPRR